MISNVMNRFEYVLKFLNRKAPVHAKIFMSPTPFYKNLILGLATLRIYKHVTLYFQE